MWRESDEECSERLQERDSLQTYQTKDQALLYDVDSEDYNSQVQKLEQQAKENQHSQCTFEYHQRWPALCQSQLNKMRARPARGGGEINTG